MARKRDRVKHYARQFASGGKQTGMAVVAGGATYAVHMQLNKMLPSIFGHYIYGPSAMIVVGHLMSKKPKLRGAGTAIAGVGGYLLTAGVFTRGLLQTSGLQESSISELTEGDAGDLAGDMLQDAVTDEVYAV